MRTPSSTCMSSNAEWNRLRKTATHPDSIKENKEKARQMARLSGEFGEGPIRKRFNYIWPRLSKMSWAVDWVNCPALMLQTRIRNRLIRRGLIPLALLAALLGTPAAAEQTIAEAMAAYERGDYATAMRGFRVHAEQGHKNAAEAKDVVRPRMTAEQIARAQELSATLFDRINPSE